MSLADGTYLSLWRGILPYRPTMKAIAEEVAERWGVTLDDMRAMVPAKWADVRPRDEALALIRETGRFSYPQMGRFFRRDHSSCMTGVRRHYRRAAEAREAAQVLA